MDGMNNNTSNLFNDGSPFKSVIASLTIVFIFIIFMISKKRDNEDGFTLYPTRINSNWF